MNVFTECSGKGSSTEMENRAVVVKIRSEERVCLMLRVYSKILLQRSFSVEKQHATRRGLEQTLAYRQVHALDDNQLSHQ